MPKDEWGNIVSVEEQDHNLRGGQWFSGKDDMGNMITQDSRGNQLHTNSHNQKTVTKK